MTIPLTDVRDISCIAYGFMGSKALFAALNIDLFGHLVRNGKTLDALIEETGVASNRLSTLLAALTSIGLVTREATTYRNAPASDRYLVREAPAYFGDYYRFQIDRQIYPALVHLDAGIAGALCQRNPELRATVLDFPNVIDVAERFVKEANLGDRIDTIRADAVEGEWPREQDIVLFSYLLSAVAESSFPLLLAKAWEAVRSGGRLLIHDFMLDDNETGPALAALWFLQYLWGRIDGISFSAATLAEQLRAHGYVDISDQVVIPEITKMVICSKGEK
jgi:hypothetical protein